MPQAPQELRDEWADDSAAWKALRGNYTDDRGIIRPKQGHAVTNREWSAIQYLCYEWDYGYEPSKSGAASPAPQVQEEGEKKCT